MVTTGVALLAAINGERVFQMIDLAFSGAPNENEKARIIGQIKRSARMAASHGLNALNIREYGKRPTPHYPKASQQRHSAYQIIAAYEKRSKDVLHVLGEVFILE